MFVVQRIPDGAFVACPGSASSYTRSVNGAQLFKTREDAVRASCPDNERAVHLRDVFTCWPKD